MNEFEQIKHMQKEGKLDADQAKLLEEALISSKNRKVQLNRPQAETERDPSGKTVWLMTAAAFLILLLALVWSVKYKPLFFLLLLALFSFGCSAAVFLLFFNILVWKKEDIRRVNALILNEYERKAVLVPQIWDTARSYADVEADTFEKVTRSRGQKHAGFSESAGLIDRQISAIKALAENYPELKSNQTYSRLLGELVETENRITAMAAWHNHKVQKYNGMVASFPFSIVASAFSFRKANYFESESL